jgi:type IV secretion system protein VirB5
MEKDFNAAKQLYLEQFGSAIVTNTYLKIALLCLSLVAVGLIVVAYKTFDTFQHLRPLVIRINEVGRAEAVAYDSFRYTPQETELKYFLIQFVTRHYSRMRATVRETYASSLFFLDGRLADGLLDANKKTKLVETFLTSHSDDIDIAVKNVSIEDLRTPPYKATVDFDKVYYRAFDRQEIKRERYVAHLVFVVRDRVDHALIPINPLGLTITYFRDDQAFVNDAGATP